MSSYAKRCADLARLRKETASRQVHGSVGLTLAIILLGVPARSQSGPSSQASANDLAGRVITLDVPTRKRTVSEEQVAEIIETKEGSLRRLLSINDRPLTAKQQ